MKYMLSLFIVLASAAFAQDVIAGEIRVASADGTAADADLRRTLGELRMLAAAGKAENIRRVEAYFAGRTKTFTRGLDPFEAWRPGPWLTRDYLEGAASLMVEQGEFQEGRALPDYRLEAMKLLASLIPGDARFGALPEMPGAQCTPAGYKVNRKAALAFSKRFGQDADGLHFFASEVFLARAPESRQGERVAANTLIIFDNHLDTPQGWMRSETAGGVKGYLKERDDMLGFSQNHVCFAKVKGRYRITALFGYGL